MDPSGATSEWQANAAGRGAVEIVDYFEEHYGPDLSGAAALALALDGLAAGVDELEAAAVDAAIVDEESHEDVADDRLRASLAD